MKRKLIILWGLAAWIFLLVTAGIAQGRIIYVDDDANGLNDGTSWQSAYNYLQDALADANSSDKPVEIWVAQGIYRPDRNWDEPNGSGDREATFQLINGVTLKGGYAGFGQTDPNERDVRKYETVLSGQLNGIDSYHAVTGSGTDANAVLDGFTIIGSGMYNEYGSPTVTNCIFGTSSGGYGGCVYNYYGNPSFVNCLFSRGLANAGGGMCNWYSSPTLTNCTFSENKTGGGMMDLGGGGMCNWYSSPTLTDCTFSKNSGSWGGGMLNYYSSVTLVQCTFIENSAGSGGGMCNRYNNSVKLTDCTFNRNSGGGIYNEGNSSLTLSNCIFSENSSRYDGGGVCGGALTMTNCVFTQNLAKGSGGGMCGGGTIVNCTFSGNSAGYYGGGMAVGGNPRLVNCTFSGNSAGKEGGGMCIGGGTPILSNCTFAGNLAENGKALACAYVPLGGESGNVQGINCILWDGGDEILWAPTYSKVDITYSDVQGGWPDEGNIDKDPCFAAPGYWDPNGTPEDVNDDFWVDGDYHLMSQAGRWDANSQSWVKDNITSPCIDAGDPKSPIGLEPFPNGGIINMGAYGGTAEASKSYFGKPPCETIVAGDINGDCVVNFKDFALLAFHWLEEH
jgi:predicted outer membrane repeat protein